MLGRHHVGGKCAGTSFDRSVQPAYRVTPHCFACVLPYPLNRLQQELELQQHSLQLLTERMAGSEGHQLAAALAATEEQLQEAKQQATAAADKKKEMVELAKVGLSGHAASCAGHRHTCCKL